MTPRALAFLLLCSATALVPPPLRTRQPTHLSATLTVYSTLGCPHCQRCKKALDAAGLAYDVVDVADAAARAALEARCGLPTVPQVYLDDERVGGADDTLKALADGWLLERDIARVEPKQQVEKTDATVVFIEAPPPGGSAFTAGGLPGNGPLLHTTRVGNLSWFRRKQSGASWTISGLYAIRCR